MFRRREPAPPREGLVVGPADRVHGTVTAQSVTVEGEFDGTLTVRERLVVAPGGTVTGAIETVRLSVEAGATVRASCRIGIAADETLPAMLMPQERVVSEPAAAVTRRDPRPPRDDEGSGGGTGLGW